MNKKRPRRDTRLYRVEINAPFAEIDTRIYGYQLYKFLRQMRKLQDAHIIQEVKREMLAEGSNFRAVTEYRLRKCRADNRFGMKVAIQPFQYEMFNN